MSKINARAFLDRLYCREAEYWSLPNHSRKKTAAKAIGASRCLKSLRAGVDPAEIPKADRHDLAALCHMGRSRLEMQGGILLLKRGKETWELDLWEVLMAEMARPQQKFELGESA